LESDVFEKDFDPNEHDEDMKKMFGDEYYNQEDNNPEVNDIEKIQENDIDIIRIEKTEDLPIGIKEGATGTWWMCDGCKQGIPENNWRFDCTECENYTLCESCRTTVVHDHRLKRFRVPLGCAPPSEIVSVMCDGCRKDITSELRFDCNVCEDYSLCENCNENVEHPHKLKSVQDLWEELEALDYEDNISGLPCKFKYRHVKPQDYGLTEDEIFNWDDSKLNKLVSLKKLAPYRDEEENFKISNKKKKFVEKSKDKKNKYQKSSREDSYKI
jgi:protein KRI1